MFRRQVFFDAAAFGVHAWEKGLVQDGVFGRYPDSLLIRDIESWGSYMARAHLMAYVFSLPVFLRLDRNVRFRPGA